MKTDYDETIGNINIIPQDIGRVLLNLYNNAFYTTNEKSKLIARKRPVTIGLLNNDLLEIKSGLKEGDVLITEGFQSLYDGQLITTQ